MRMVIFRTIDKKKLECLNHFTLEDTLEIWTCHRILAEILKNIFYELSGYLH